MNNIIIVILLCLTLQGCSLIKAVVSPFKPTKTTLPQEITRGNNLVKCYGEFKTGTDGSIYCSKGYYLLDKNYSEKERTLTLKEKLLGYMNKLMGWSFWIVVALIFLCPSLLGWIIGRVFNAGAKLTSSALNQTMTAIKNYRKVAPPAVKEALDNQLRASQDVATKEIVNQFRATTG